MRLVIGLGNPGAEYRGTRHNVGFEVIARLAERHAFPASKAFKKAEVSRGHIEGQEVLLMQPMTYMNLSGDAVSAVMRYYKCEPADLIVVHDELDFEPGQVRVKRDGGHGGNNGLRSIIAHVGRDFPRVRVGIGKPPRGRGADHVLGRFSKLERVEIDEAIERACDAVEVVLSQGVQRAMNQYNQRSPSSEDGAADA